MLSSNSPLHFFLVTSSIIIAAIDQTSFAKNPLTDDPNASKIGRSSEFSDYPAEAQLTGRQHPPVLNNKNKKLYQTMLEKAFRQGVNFSGHYNIVAWGCGTGCTGWAVVDLQSGNVAMQDDLTACIGNNRPPDGEIIDDDGFIFYKNSSLLYARSCENWSYDVLFDTLRVYQSTATGLKLLRTEKRRVWGPHSFQTDKTSSPSAQKIY